MDNTMTRREKESRYMADSVAILQLSISRATFYRYLESGVITPPETKIGKNRRGWTTTDIELARQEVRTIQQVRRADD
jgi:predicted DNA-binding transcriptional regulator AlpA